jgi:hypothetical protein
MPAAGASIHSYNVSEGKTRDCYVAHLFRR